MTGVFKAVFHGLVALYGLGILLILLARRLVGERSRLIAFLNIGLHLLVLPATFLLPLLVTLRRWKLAALLFPAGVPALTAYAGLPRSQPAAQCDLPAVRVLTYNLHVEKRTLQPMIDIIIKAEADLVLLQEVTQKAAREFKKALAERYPHQVMIPDPYSDRGIGRAVLSRFPLLESETWQAPLRQPTRLIRLDALIHGTRLTIYNLHASSYFPMGRRGFDIRPRSRQIQHILAQAGFEQYPVIWAGDFNMTEWSDDYRRIRAHFGDAYAAAGRRPGFTYPDYSTAQSWINRRLPRFLPPITRIDYIFYSQGLEAREAQVWPHSGGSDHRPVYAVLALKDCSN